MNDGWIHESVLAIAAEPARVAELFPAAGRAVGRDPLAPDDDPLGLVHGTLDDRAREELLRATLAALPPQDAARAIDELYRFGDDAERRGVLRGLGAAGAAGPAGPEAAPIVAVGLDLVADALRTNDPRLVAAALGPFAARHLDQHSWRHGVLKALFMGIPLAAVSGLERRADGELARMVAALVAERRAASRPITDDMTRLATATDPEGE
ncbi:EboA domain-containing protein [Agromyces sp. NPDC058484]|uniref:EboA domain-containing protein n=1 Tax=Agromyces sp. NPDC058484 TaxID=3346524 RepID=UPI003653E678